MVLPVAVRCCTGREVEPVCVHEFDSFLVVNTTAIDAERLGEEKSLCTYVTWGKVAYSALPVLVGPSRARFSAIRATVLEQQLQACARANSIPTREHLTLRYTRAKEVWLMQQCGHLCSSMLINEREMLLVVDLKVSHSFRNRVRFIQHDHVLQLVRWMMTTHS